MAKRLDVPILRAVDCANELGESPVWSAPEQALYWVDILAPAVHYWHPVSATQRVWRMPAAVGSMGLRESGGLVVALRSGFHLFDPQSEAVTLLAHPEPDTPTNRLNDGKVAPDGSFWAGTMDDRPEKEPVASLYRLGADHRVKAMASGFKVSNGLAWSPDGTALYHSDSRAGRVWRYAYDVASGEIGARSDFIVYQPEWGRPDGAAVDAEGCYWSCGVSAGRINRFSPSGELIAWIELPVTHPTMPCFGGKDLKTLYVTTLREGFSAEQLRAQPWAGAVLAMSLDVAGTPVARYRG
ncbi:MAG: SMP-30/gluconolactonase/LRE family protein [Comamonadaceae bacterium]|nr:SMP-30/gluconolactonase/LRE family protein [Comamonadaceae bacterium]